MKIEIFKKIQINVRASVDSAFSSLFLLRLLDCQKINISGEGDSFLGEGDPIRHLLLHCIAKAKTTRAKVDFLLRNIKTSFVQT